MPRLQRELSQIKASGDAIDHETVNEIGDLDVSELGSRLRKEILKSKFTGLSGERSLVDGKIQPLALQIINIAGDGERVIGFWVPDVGIAHQPNGSSKAHLLPVFWPGEEENTTKPQGWIESPNEKKLKIGYLVKDDVSEFVNVSSNGTVVTGYSIEVFETVVKALPFYAPYMFIPFKSTKDETAGSYNDLVDQVILKKYDAAVGDITITPDRSSIVDFSIPYTLGGVAMIIPIKYEEINKMQVFLNDLSWHYICLPFAYFALIFAVWMVQVISFCIAHESSFFGIFPDSSVHSLNIEGGKQGSKIIFHIFGIGCLCIVAYLVLQVLCYQNFKLNDIDAKYLVRSGEFVGYMNGSFVGIVLKKLKFDNSQLKVYNSREDYDEALNKGSKNGGVSAIFDEIPYIKGFLGKHCGKYRRAGPTYQMKGFGFVFPKGSHMVPEFSRAISSILEGDQISQIDKRWAWSNTTCADPTVYIMNISYWRLWVMLVAFLLFLIRILTYMKDYIFGITERPIHGPDEAQPESTNPQLQGVELNTQSASTSSGVESNTPQTESKPTRTPDSKKKETEARNKKLRIH